MKVAMHLVCVIFTGNRGQIFIYVGNYFPIATLGVQPQNGLGMEFLTDVVVVSDVMAIPHSCILNAPLHENERRARSKQG